MQTVPHRLLLAYRGQDFFGWQRQDPQPTVQLALEKALQKIFDLPVAVAGSGRTDRGVHALGQVASCDLPPLYPPATLAKALNYHLPPGVRVLSARREKPGFHARFSAKGKSYLYRIANTDVLHPLEIGRAWHLPRPLHLARMRLAAKILQGQHDFAAFTSNPGYARKSTVRRLRSLRLAKKKGGLLELTFTGDGFLFRMVRNLVGALAKVGQGRLTPAELKKILQSRTRSLAPPTAPAHGLYLLSVKY